MTTDSSSHSSSHPVQGPSSSIEDVFQMDPIQDISSLESQEKSSSPPSERSEEDVWASAWEEEPPSQEEQEEDLFSTQPYLLYHEEEPLPPPSSPVLAPGKSLNDLAREIRQSQGELNLGPSLFPLEETAPPESEHSLVEVFSLSDLPQTPPLAEETPSSATSSKESVLSQKLAEIWKGSPALDFLVDRSPLGNPEQFSIHPSPTTFLRPKAPEAPHSAPKLISLETQRVATLKIKTPDVPPKPPITIDSPLYKPQQHNPIFPTAPPAPNPSFSHAATPSSPHASSEATTKGSSRILSWLVLALALICLLITVLIVNGKISSLTSPPEHSTPEASNSSLPQNTQGAPPLSKDPIEEKIPDAVLVPDEELPFKP